MDDLDPRFIQLLILVVVVFVAIARLFYRIFVKPFVPPNAPTTGLPPVRRAPRQHEIKDFLEELRRDLGHGEAPPPRRSDGLMDEERTGAGYLESRHEEARAAPPIPRPFQPQPPRPVAHDPAPFAAEKAARQEAAREDEASRRRVVARREAIARADKADAILQQRSSMEEGIAAVSPISQGDLTSLPERTAGDAAGDTVFGVDLERAVMLQQIFGPPNCRRPRRPRVPKSGGKR